MARQCCFDSKHIKQGCEPRVESKQSRKHAGKHGISHLLYPCIGLSQGHLSPLICPLDNIALRFVDDRRITRVNSWVQLQLHQLIVENSRVERRQRNVRDLIWSCLCKVLSLGEMLKDGSMARALDGEFIWAPGQSPVKRRCEKALKEDQRATWPPLNFFSRHGGRIRIGVRVLVWGGGYENTGRPHGGHGATFCTETTSDDEHFRNINRHQVSQW